MATMDTKMSFTLKDLIMFITFLGAGFGAYFNITSDQDVIRAEQVVAKEERSELKEANKAYAGLPADVKKMQLDIAKNAKVTTAIYYGLLANGTIKPPQQ